MCGVECVAHLVFAELSLQVGERGGRVRLRRRVELLLRVRHLRRQVRHFVAELGLLRQRRLEDKVLVKNQVVSVRVTVYQCLLVLVDTK